MATGGRSRSAHGPVPVSLIYSPHLDAFWNQSYTGVLAVPYFELLTNDEPKTTASCKDLQLSAPAYHLELYRRPVSNQSKVVVRFLLGPETFGGYSKAACCWI